MPLLGDLERPEQQLSHLIDLIGVLGGAYHASMLLHQGFPVQSQLLDRFRLAFVQPLHSEVEADDLVPAIIAIDGAIELWHGSDELFLFVWSHLHAPCLLNPAHLLLLAMVVR